MLNLTPAERSVLRAEAHGLKPIVLVGESGLTPSVMKEIELGLDSHGLIKVRVFGDDREARIDMYETICEKTGAAPVQHIGKLLVLYRPKVDAEKTGSGKAGKGMRMVTIVKPSASGTKKPSVKKVLLKGNERVTAGGTIKRVKKKTGTKKELG
jgi:RNA-binding protein